MNDENLNVLYINGFPDNFRSRDIFELFTKKFKNIRNVNIFYSKKKGPYALIQFGNNKLIKDAVSMSNMSIMYDDRYYKIIMCEYFTKSQRRHQELNKELGEIIDYKNQDEEGPSRSRRYSTRSRSMSRSPSI